MRRQERNSNSKNRSSRNRSSNKSSKRTFNYKKRDVESVKKRSNQGSGNRDQIFKDEFNVFKLTDDNNIRILPPTWDDPEHYAFDIWVHYSIGPDESSFICLDKINSDEKCPICEERSKAESEGDSDYASELKPTKRPACYVIDRDNESDGALLWAMPWTVDRDLSVQSFDKRTGEVIPLDDPYDGYDVSFNRSGKGRNTKYIGLSINRRSSEASDDDLDEILEYIQENPIPETLNIQDADYISSVFSGNSKSSNEKEKDDKPFQTWKSIHKMDFDELEDLIDDEKLDIDYEDFNESDELADEICEEMNIDKPNKNRGRDSNRDKAKQMRNNRR